MNLFELEKRDNDDRIILNEQSGQVEIRKYFEKILELTKCNKEFPVSLGDVWGLAYTKKGNAFDSLKENFIEGIDFYLLQQQKVVNSSELRNGIRMEVFMTVPCFEYFIARKVRPVFDVYREVFHKAMKTAPLTLLESLKLAVIQEEEIQRQKLELAEKNDVIESQRTAVEFTENVSKSVTDISVRDLAKILNQSGFDMGQNRLFEWLIENGYVLKENRRRVSGEYKTDYTPTQKASDLKVLKLVEYTINSDNRSFVSKSVKITGKGQVYFVKKFKDMYGENNNQKII